MKASYFYNRLLGYKKEELETGKYYYGYCNNMVTIHRTGEEYPKYIISSNGNVNIETINEYSNNVMSIDDLDGDSYELYNSVQIFKSGYLLFDNTKSETDIKYLITNLFDLIENLETNNSNSCICGCTLFDDDHLTDSFSYHCKNGIELELSTIRRLCKENVNRKYYDAKCYPFIKNINNTQAIYVKFISFIEMDSKDIILNKCNFALRELLSYLNNTEVKWINCNINKPIYM